MPVRPVSQAFDAHRTGSTRPARPAQLDEASLNQMSSGLSPEQVSEMSHQSALALLHRVHESKDPALVTRVLTVVENEGLDIIAELWEKSEPETLPGMMWRLYNLRLWMRQNPESLSRFWRLGEPVVGAASAITGIDEAPTAEDIAATADSILTGAFVGDFSVALQRASAFVMIEAAGMDLLAAREAHELPELEERRLADSGTRRRMAHISALRATASRLAQTGKDFRAGASLWKQGKLE